MKLALLLVTFTSAWALAAEAWIPKPPLGLDLYLPIPAANSLTREKITIGRRFFFDKRLSRDGTVACASCHDPRLAFSDGRTIARGIHGNPGTRNVPSLINRGYGEVFFWDGRVDSLEMQALQPIINPIEMGLTESELEHRTGMKSTAITDAIASYVRTIRSGDSRFDRYVAGQTDSLTATEKTGLAVFRGKGRCTACHAGPNFTDERFHNTGVAWREGHLTDEGRFVVSGNPHDRGAFKTPTLRDVARTAPYMHDGSLATLEDVIDFYSEGGRQNPQLDEEIRPRHFNRQEKRALAAFVRSLNGRIHEGI